MQKRDTLLFIYNVLKNILGVTLWHMVLTSSIIGVQGVPGNNLPLKRFEYKYSFKPPYLAQKDGTVPFFEYSGSKLQLNLLFKINNLASLKFYLGETVFASGFLLF